MLQAIVDRAQRSIETLVSKYVRRAAVGVPFVIALGFGTAAATVKLTAEFGSMVAYAILAVAFASVGLAAAAAIAMSGPNSVATPATGDDATASIDATGKESAIGPDVILAALGAVGPAALPGMVRLLARNLSLVLAVAIIAYLLFSDTKKADADTRPSAA